MKQEVGDTVGKNSKLPQTYRNALRGATDPFKSVSKVRNTIRPEMYEALIAWLPNVRYKGRGVVGGRTPRDLTAIKTSTRVFDPLSLENELLWTATFLRNSAVLINSFRRLAEDFEYALFAQGYEEAHSALDSIERECGISLWSIELRIAVLQLWKGLEAQKILTNQIRESRAKGDVVSFLAYYISVRNEDTVNPFSLRDEILEASTNWRITDDFRKYLLHRLVDLWPTDVAGISAILRHEATSATIDYYETFVRVATKAIAGDSEGSIARLFATPLGLLLRDVEDLRLTKLLAICKGRHWPADPLENTDPEDSLLEGRYGAAYELSTARPVSKPFDTSLLVTAIKAAVELPSEKVVKGDSFTDQILSLGLDLVSKDRGFEQAFISLARLTLNLRYLAAASVFEAFAWEEVSTSPIPDAQRGISAYILSPFVTSRVARFLPPEKRNSYFHEVSQAFVNSSAAQFEFDRAGLGCSLHGLYSHETTLRRDIDRLLGIADFGACLETARSLEASDSVRMRRIATRCEAFCLLQMDRLSEAVDFIARHALDDQGVIRMLPIGECTSKLNKTNLRELAPSITTPILLDVAARYLDDAYGNRRSYAYEDFLNAHSVERPSELKDHVAGFNKQLLTYYLRYICVPEVMQVSIAFNSSKELEEERLRVCNILLSLDPDNSSEYEAEIRTITRKHAIRRGLRQVEQSKISIETEPIRRWAAKELKESFIRYQSLRATQITSGQSAIAKAYEEALQRPTPVGELPDLPKDEATDLLVLMVTRFLRECFTNPFHGLDCYLSMRVRHGALSGQLRGPLEEEKIITQREVGSDEYKTNEYWVPRISAVDARLAEGLDKRLKTFSRDYDALIDTFANNYVQIQGPERLHGLFKSVLSPLTLVVLAAEVRPDTTFDAFVDLCFHIFWDNVGTCLKSINDYIDSSLKPAINTLFTSLLMDVELSYVRITDLNSAIRSAQTKAQQAVDQVKDWFRPALELPSRHFSFQELFDIGLEQVKKIHPEFDPKITSDIGEMPSFIELNRFSDIFFIILDNISKHSGLSDPKIEVSAHAVDRTLKINIRNQVSSESRGAASDRVKRVRAAIAEGTLQRATRSEGGTGLIKLRNIVRQDEQIAQNLDFGFADDGCFFVKIELPFTEVEIYSPEGA